MNLLSLRSKYTTLSLSTDPNFLCTDRKSTANRLKTVVSVTDETGSSSKSRFTSVHAAIHFVMCAGELEPISRLNASPLPSVPSDSFLTGSWISLQMRSDFVVFGSFSALKYRGLHHKAIGHG